jgi:two-component system chemotaxis response regulator CheY
MLSRLKQYGTCQVATDGIEAVVEVSRALQAAEPFDLICLDLNMPNMDGQTALRTIRALEKLHGRGPGDGARIMVVSAVGEQETILSAYRDSCDAYLVKPIDEAKLREELQKLKLIPG